MHIPMPANFVIRYVTSVSVSAAARSFNPLLILLRENVQHMPDTPTKRTTMNGCPNDQNQPFSRYENTLTPNSYLTSHEKCIKSIRIRAIPLKKSRSHACSFTAVFSLTCYPALLQDSFRELWHKPHLQELSCLLRKDLRKEEDMSGTP